MSNRTPIEVTQITSTTTYAGGNRLYWLLIAGSTNITVTVADDSTDLLYFDCPNGETLLYTFVPSVTFKTSLKITITGTGKVSVARAGA
tara:strand:- start:56 stop:322 length:267 start_codon:yes stop_codon:yes gene_type:complete